VICIGKRTATRFQNYFFRRCCCLDSGLKRQCYPSRWSPSHALGSRCHNPKLAYWALFTKPRPPSINIITGSDNCVRLFKYEYLDPAVRHRLFWSAERLVTRGLVSPWSLRLEDQISHLGTRVDWADTLGNAASADELAAQRSTGSSSRQPVHPAFLVPSLLETHLGRSRSYSTGPASSCRILNAPTHAFFLPSLPSLVTRTSPPHGNGRGISCSAGIWKEVVIFSVGAILLVSLVVIYHFKSIHHRN